MTAAVAIAVAVAGGSSAGTRSRTAAAPTLYFVYAMNCTFTIIDDSGKPVTSVAPGRYQIDVRTPIVFGTMPPIAGASPSDMTACRGVPQFQLVGPGVNLTTTMAAGCISDYLTTGTFQPSATYVAEDLNQPSVAHASFTTLASGTPAVPPSTYGGGTGTGQESTDLVGSLAVKGTLSLTVARTGTIKLTRNGKAISTSKLPAGRYTVRLLDLDPGAGLLLLGPTSRAPTILTKADFIGAKTKTLTLTKGRWTYYSSLKHMAYFVVG
jgi:hypothetical protein